MSLRKTPPVSTQVVEPYTKRNALFGKRLVDFDTGSDCLEDQHKKWLQEAMSAAKNNAEICIVLVGYASRLGDPERNRNLSNKRVMSVLNYMRQFDARVLQNSELYWCGEDESVGAENAPEWRAVEVHVYVESCERSGLRTPPPPSWKRLPPPIMPQLPGGTRYKEWSVASPGGGQATVAIISGGFNIFFIRNDVTKEERGYINPCGGAAIGIGLKLKGLPAMVKLIFETIRSGITASPLSYTSVVKPSADLIKPLNYPVTWQEMESCFVTVPSVGVGKSFANITFHSNGVYIYGPSGLPVLTAMDLFTFRSTGYGFQASAGAVGGPLIRVG